MLTDEELEALPDDAIAAFIVIEEKLRKNAQQRMDEEGGFNLDASLEYIGRMLAAATALEIKYFDGFEIPDRRELIFDYYTEFVVKVDVFITSARITKARRLKGKSVALDVAAKERLRSLISQIREIVDRLEVDAAKKDSLHKRLSEFEEEINRSRTAFAALGELWISFCENIGEGTAKLKPAVDMFERIGEIIGKAKREEVAGNPQLPPPPETRRLEPPRKELPPPELDDEIPF